MIFSINYDNNELLISFTTLNEYNKDGDTIEYCELTTNVNTYDDNGLLLSTATVEETDNHAYGILEYNY